MRGIGGEQEDALAAAGEVERTGGRAGRLPHAALATEEEEPNALGRNPGSTLAGLRACRPRARRLRPRRGEPSQGREPPRLLVQRAYESQRSIRERLARCAQDAGLLGAPAGAECAG